MGMPYPTPPPSSQEKFLNLVEHLRPLLGLSDAFWWQDDRLPQHEYLFFLHIVPYNTGFSFPHWPSQVRVVRLIVFTLRTNFGRKTRKIRRFFCIACSHLATFNMLHITCQHMCYVPYIGIRSNANWRPWWVRGKEVWLKPVTPGWMSPRKQWLPPGFMQWLLSRPEENMLSMHYFRIIGPD